MALVAGADTSEGARALNTSVISGSRKATGLSASRSVTESPVRRRRTATSVVGDSVSLTARDVKAVMSGLRKALGLQLSTHARSGLAAMAPHLSPAQLSALVLSLIERA